MPTIQSELEYSNITRIAGQSELLAVDVIAGADGYNRLTTANQQISSGINAEISVSTSAVEAKADTNRLSGRRFLSFMPLNGIVYYGFSNSVTVNTGMKVFTNQLVTLEIGDIPLYLIASGSVSIRVMEAK